MKKTSSFPHLGLVRSFTELYRPKSTFHGLFEQEIYSMQLVKNFLQVADIDSIFSVSLWSCLFALYYTCLTFCFASCEKICLSMFVCLVCHLLSVCILYYLLIFIFNLGDQLR